MDKKIARMRAKWNDVSRQCYELQKQTYPIFIRNSEHPSIVRKYKNMRLKEEQLAKIVAELEQKRNAFCNQHNETKGK